MRFRPCIDIHNGKVKQIVGSSLKDEADQAVDNFVSEQDGSFYGEFYKKDGLYGGHIILLNPQTSPFYEEDKKQAALALAAFPGGMQIGGGINAETAAEFLALGATHVIVTSYVFRDGKINYENLGRMVTAVGRERLVLDLSCRKRDDSYYIVTDRWQKFTDVPVTHELLTELSVYCDEFLIHAVDVEGKTNGVEEELIELLGNWKGIPVTYAGGVRSLKDIEIIRKLGNNRLDVTIGSALDLFGGNLSYKDVISYMNGTRVKQ